MTCSAKQLPFDESKFSDQQAQQHNCFPDYAAISQVY
jgi:hypothetical protein